MLGGSMRDQQHPGRCGARRGAGALSMIRSRAPISRRRMALSTLNTNSASDTGAPAARWRLHCWEGLLIRGRPARPSGKPQAKAKAGQATNQSYISQVGRAATGCAAARGKASTPRYRCVAPLPVQPVRVADIGDAPDVPPADRARADARCATSVSASMCRAGPSRACAR